MLQILGNFYNGVKNNTIEYITNMVKIYHFYGIETQT